MPRSTLEQGFHRPLLRERFPAQPGEHEEQDEQCWVEEDRRRQAKASCEFVISYLRYRDIGPGRLKKKVMVQIISRDFRKETFGKVKRKVV